MFRVEDNGVLLAIVGYINDIKDGWHFYGDAQDPLQCGTCKAREGLVLQPHIHKVRERLSLHKTQEFIVVMSGSLKVAFFNTDKEPVTETVLGVGNFVCLYEGGHGFKVLEDGTRFIEVKSGPFASVEEDKERFESAVHIPV